MSQSATLRRSSIHGLEKDILRRRISARHLERAPSFMNAPDVESRLDEAPTLGRATSEPGRNADPSELMSLVGNRSQSEPSEPSVSLPANVFRAPNESSGNEMNGSSAEKEPGSAGDDELPRPGAANSKTDQPPSDTKGSYLSAATLSTCVPTSTSTTASDSVDNSPRPSLSTIVSESNAQGMRSRNNQRARRLMAVPGDSSASAKKTLNGAASSESLLLETGMKDSKSADRIQKLKYLWKTMSSGTLVPLVGFSMILLNQLFPTSPRLIAAQIGLFMGISYMINRVKIIHRSVKAVTTYLFPPKVEKKVDLINWSVKMRVFVGGGGKLMDSGKGGHLAEMLATTAFRDALLEYANQFWLDRDRPEHVNFDTVALEVIDYGDIETKGHDGKVTRKSQKKTLFIPLQTEAGPAINLSGIVDLFTPLDRQSPIRKFFAARWAWLQSVWRFCVYFEVPDEDENENEANQNQVDEFGFAPLSESGDIRLGIGKPPPRKRKKKDSDGDGEAEDSVAPEGSPIYLDIYGDECLFKLQNFVQTVSERSWKAPKATGAEESKQLFWYTMSRWDSDGRWPIFKKSPIFGDREYHLNYHQAFFHPKKNQILGNPQALLDQFLARSGNYSVLGASQKLNFLFHGPPGTGKSKLVRTMAMYLQRHVVSFQLSQVETEENLLTLLDDLKAITDSSSDDGQFTFRDLLFVIEEVDTDPRGICLQREMAAPTEEKEDEDEKDEQKQEDGEKPQTKKKKQQQQKPKSGTQLSPPLSLGLLLRTLDGGSETPGRIICMTTNRVDQLDEAFKRPGRLKKIQLDNLAYPELKQMIWHFRSEEGGVPTSHLWTAHIDHMGQQIMNDYKRTEALRTSDLDARGLGLSPAMLEELCMDSLSLQQLFELLIEELMRQWTKAELEDEPLSKDMVENFDWRMNTVRQSVLYNLSDPAKFKEAVRCWPEAACYDGDSDSGLCDSSDEEKKEEEPEVTVFMRELLHDETVFNDSIEVCPTDYGIRYEELRYRLQVELVLRDFNEDVPLARILTMFMDELMQKWKVAFDTDDVEMQALLNNKRLPPSLDKFKQLSLIKKK